MQAEGATCSKGTEVSEVSVRNLRYGVGENGEKGRGRLGETHITLSLDFIMKAMRSH